ncbi:YcaO-like family protein [Pseudomonas sp. LS1212]|uniref:YcaO-like family protein n=1 Tax=Pseudomonas sp. LS1212 TaxID=2972478 RepID=UPI00215CBF69|nr:YcaO-like family protein [Pseudomonas sp. LS1212]UVJ42289.1 YcaO-like family protein [Pseudomonas sp. LS1212]
MNLFNIETSAFYPGSLSYQPSAMTGLPNSIEIGNYWSIHGSGIGDGTTAQTTALGEFFERRHFYMEVTADSSSTLSDALCKEESNDFIAAFTQTSTEALSENSLVTHAFNMSTVVRTKDFSTCLIPTVCLSLSFFENTMDNSIYPARDTCGCSFHSSAEQAIFGAIKESLERQFLTRFWITGNCSRIIDNSIGSDWLSHSTERHLFKALCCAGEVTIIDITDENFPGTCLLLVYGCSDQMRNVQYCAGMSYNNSPQSALEKALLELWQTYRFIDRFRETSSTLKDIDDPYLIHFLKCNEFKTYKNIIATNESLHSPPPEKHEFNASTLINEIRNKELNGYLYLRPLKIMGQFFYFCKFTSPNLFMHMNNSSNINLSNRYSKAFSESFIPNRLTTMVPFP